MICGLGMSKEPVMEKCLFCRLDGKEMSDEVVRFCSVSSICLCGSFDCFVEVVLIDVVDQCVEKCNQCFSS